jgi:hypothetical protein
LLPPKAANSPSTRGIWKPSKNTSKLPVTLLEK